MKTDINLKKKKIENEISERDKHDRIHKLGTPTDNFKE